MTRYTELLSQGASDQRRLVHVERRGYQTATMTYRAALPETRDTSSAQEARKSTEEALTDLVP